MMENQSSQPLNKKASEPLIDNKTTNAKEFKLTGGTSGVIVGVIAIIYYFVNGPSFVVYFLLAGSLTMIGRVVLKWLDDLVD